MLSKIQSATALLRVRRGHLAQGFAPLNGTGLSIGSPAWFGCCLLGALGFVVSIYWLRERFSRRKRAAAATPSRGGPVTGESAHPWSSLASGTGMTGFLGARALIVEDVDYAATALGFMLKELGFCCDRAGAAHEALRMLREQPYDSVFVDYHLPDMSGAELVRLAKARARPGETPLFIATTASTTAASRRNCVESGMDAFVAKPVTPERLHRALLHFAAPLRAGISVQLPGVGPLTFDVLDYLGGDTVEGRQASRAEYAGVMAEILQTMKNAIQQDEREPARRAAHQLVGHARLIGAERLALLAEQLEQQALYAPTAALTGLTSKIEDQAGDLTQTLTGPAPRPPTTG